MAMGEVIIDSFRSHVLEQNPLKDPAIRKIPVYLPPTYASTMQRYPVVFLLSGFTGRGISMLNREAFSEAIDERLNRLIEAKIIKPMIVVMPDCFTYYGGSQYLNSTATGDYETHLIEELVPYIKNEFRSQQDSAYWSIAGKSSGGFGAITLGMHHPDVFSTVACHSGDMGFEYCYLPDFPETMIEIEKAQGLDNFMRQFYSMPKIPHSKFTALNIIAMAAAYSPNLKTKPHLFDFPFDLKTGNIVPSIWDKWLEKDPVRMVQAHEDQLRKLNIYVDCGTRDEFRL